MNRPVRARVLKLEEGIATLSIYASGTWVRLRANTQVPLQPGNWIEGHLSVLDDGETVVFRLSNKDDAPLHEGSGLDLEV